MWAEADLPRAPVGDFPPRWCSAFGDDEFGLWADLAVGGVVQRLRWIEPGSFTMGSTAEERRRIEVQDIRKWADERESPPHPVTISRGFWLADTPCTQALWLALMPKNPSGFADRPDAAVRPVEQVTWDETQELLQALQQRLPSRCEPVLPTEAQWEYACRAGTSTAYWWGDEAHADLANFGNQVEETTPVKRYRPNPWGLYDVHGNVWEWCADAPRGYLDRPEVDPDGGGDDVVRVLRGGGWFSPPAIARSAFRNLAPRGERWIHLGFRLALRSPSPGQPGQPGIGRPEGA
jgi:formylglycine-generating enzyme required for sulfatase activity